MIDSVKSLAVALLAASQAFAEYLTFEVYDAEVDPDEFAQGLFAYIQAEAWDSAGTSMTDKMFLLCTSCTISYILTDEVPAAAEAAVNMAFPGATALVPV